MNRVAQKYESLKARESLEFAKQYETQLKINENCLVCMPSFDFNLQAIRLDIMYVVNQKYSKKVKHSLSS